MVKFIRSNPRIAMLNVMVIIFVSLFSLAMPVIFKIMIEGVLPDGNETGYWVALVVLLCVTVGKTVFGVIQDYVFLLHRQLIEVSSIKSALIIGGFKAGSIEDLCANIRNFVGKFQYFWINFLFYIAYAVFISTIVLIAFYIIEPAYFYIALVFMLLHLCNFVLFKPIIQHATETFNSRKSTLLSDLSGHMRLLPEAKSMRRQSFFVERFELSSRRYAEGYYKKELIQIWQKLVQDFLIQLFFVFFFAVVLYLSVSNRLSIGSAALCLFLSSFLFEPIYRFSFIVKLFFEARAYSSWVPEQVESASSHLPQEGALVLRQVKTKVMAERGMMPLSRTIDPGRLVLIKGISGSGKTSLLDCIAGMDELNCGEIMIGESVRSRGSIYYCEQEIAIFPGSFLDNLSFYNDDHYSCKLTQLLDAVGISDVRKRCDVDSKMLSGGQKQRVAVVRALYAGKSILLFDEPTSALDLDNELAVFALLKLAAREKIVIFVSHSSNAGQFADDIIDLDILMPEPAKA